MGLGERGEREGCPIYATHTAKKVLIKNKARHLKSPGHLIMKTNESAIEKEEDQHFCLLAETRLC